MKTACQGLNAVWDAIANGLTMLGKTWRKKKKKTTEKEIIGCMCVDDISWDAG